MSDTARRDGTDHDASMEAMARHLYGDGDMDEERQRDLDVKRMRAVIVRLTDERDAALLLMKRAGEAIRKSAEERARLTAELDATITELGKLGRDYAALQESHDDMIRRQDAAEDYKAALLMIVHKANEANIHRDDDNALCTIIDIARAALPLRDTPAPDSRGEDRA